MCVLYGLALSVPEVVLSEKKNKAVTAQRGGAAELAGFSSFLPADNIAAGGCGVWPVSLVALFSHCGTESMGPVAVKGL